MTFAVYVVTAVSAIALGTSLGLELEHALDFPLGRPAARVAAIENVLGLSALLRAKAVDLSIASLILALLSPWLQMAWLTSLSALHGPTHALWNAWGLYFRALLATLLTFLLGVVALLPWLGLGYLVHVFCTDRVNDRVHDLSVALSLTPGLLSLLVIACWHDLARARCLTTGAFRSVFGAALDALRPSVLARYVLWNGLGLSLVIAAHAWVVSSRVHGWVAGFLLLAVLQAATFGRTLLRSAWLADALACVDVAAERKRKR
jgi:hypothetical protein